MSQYTCDGNLFCQLRAPECYAGEVWKHKESNFIFAIREIVDHDYFVGQTIENGDFFSVNTFKKSYLFNCELIGEIKPVTGQYN